MNTVANNSFLIIVDTTTNKIFIIITNTITNCDLIDHHVHNNINDFIIHQRN
jgi:hypothetical protein